MFKYFIARAVNLAQSYVPTRNTENYNYLFCQISDRSRSLRQCTGISKRGDCPRFFERCASSRRCFLQRLRRQQRFR